MTEQNMSQTSYGSSYIKTAIGNLICICCQTKSSYICRDQRYFFFIFYHVLCSLITWSHQRRHQIMHAWLTR